jgi:hypothetical protein
VLIVTLSSSTSPLTSTVILRERSPRATAVVTSAMFATWVVRFAASRLTLSVRSFHVPATPGTGGLAAEPALGADLAGDARHFRGEAVELVDHRVERLLELQDLARDVDRDLLREVAARDRGRDLGDVSTWAVRFDAMKLTLSVRSFHVPATPGTAGLAAELPSVPTSRATRVTSPANALSWSTIVLIVSLSSRISPETLTVILRERSPRRHGRRDLGDVSDLRGQVAGHRR